MKRLTRVAILLMQLSATVRSSLRRPWDYPTDPNWSHPHLCHLKLVCAVSASRDRQLQEAEFMRGIRRLALQRNHISSPLLAEALSLGDARGSCSKIAPDCQTTEEELLSAIHMLGITTDRVKRETQEEQVLAESHYRPPYSAAGQLQFAVRQRSPYVAQELTGDRRREWAGDRRRPWAGDRRRPSTRRQGGLFQRMPPIIRPQSAKVRQACRDCDTRGTVCTVYGIGTFFGCTGMSFMFGFPYNILCNALTTPGSLGCSASSLYCFSDGCGLITMPGDFKS